MWKQLTGEPVAGEPHTGFGGRGRRSPFPTPIHRPVAVSQRIKKQTFANASQLDPLLLLGVVKLVFIVEEHVGRSDDPHSLQPFVPFITVHFAVVVLQLVHHASS